MGDKRLASIDLLRTLAIVLVIGFHFFYQITGDNNLRYFGFVGISLFFIISGFLLASRYPKLEGFSLKWFLKRYLRIVCLYYLALIAIVLLFSKQVYSGSLLKNLLYHFAFIDFINPETAYGIISPAWFLIPLMGFYIFFPYLNRFIKKYDYLLGFAFVFMILFRMNKGGLTSFSPLFFLGEFCFGILFAYNRKSPFLLGSLLVLIIDPIMVIPFIIFYVGYFINSKYLPARIFNFFGRRTLPLFLFHESFIRVYTDRWHLYNLEKYPALFFLLVVSVFLTYISCKIQNLIFRKHFNTKEERKFNKKMAKKKALEIFFVVICLTIIGFFIYTIISPTSSAEAEGFASLKPSLSDNNVAILLVSVESNKYETQEDTCYVIIEGEVSNIGNEPALDTIIRCRPAIYPIVEVNIQVSKKIGEVEIGNTTPFTIKREIECGQNLRFDCTAEESS